ncbi:MAG: tyrosine-type recombinase/integrase [Candidatus Dojkabacteria bacterium]
MALDNHLEQFVNYLEGIGRSRSTIIAYKKDIEQLNNFLDEEHKVSEAKTLTSELLQEYVESLIDSGNYTLKTVSRKINSLKTFCKYLLSEGLIVNDISKPISHPEFEPQLPRVLSPLEYRALRDTARSNLRLYTMVELLLQTGIRIGELSRLKRKHVQFNRKLLHVVEYSSNPYRMIELNENILAALRSFTEEFNYDTDEEHLFQTKTGRAVLIRNIRTAINRAFKKAGIKNATVNDIRNTFIVFQLENGIKTERLAEIVGHQKPTTTEKYLQLVEDRPKRTTNKIEPL